MKSKPYIIGTRGSDLALWQANTVAVRLNLNTEIKIVKTSGDLFHDIPLQGQTETGFFTKELENRLLNKDIDIAVHSLKDLPTRIHPRLSLAAYLSRGSVPDLMLVHPDWHDPSFLLPVGMDCRVGATSLRRQALLHLYAPQAKPDFLRGNVPIRIRKCKEGQYGAIVLAQAGLERLELDPSPLHVYRLDPKIWLPAPGQGVIAVQVRKDDPDLLQAAAQIDDLKTRAAAEIERRLLFNFEGGCHVAFGVFAFMENSGWCANIGLDQPGKGWVQTSISDRSDEQIKQIMPEDLTDLRAVKIKERESLCRKLQ
ncbi:MAG: hydroxymethylbilane synthase [Acidobacteria bacterium]|nr:hydroxymethylbilane synthase [Acidobacteriota bacterium]MCG2815200.1 hydroxymethylbilane synthase [Candidatus Aminicenantes bacterium]MBU1338123.1 hydroxymethylbilane synthase [Acidobacteriota bacterium]MBU1475184.1 hydroxymethylbilane synthase [Acidobacteriota bacterium]MBU2438980.1 hydroxymethylbilane synthase [Acidobacteriota bacterium]